MSNPGFPMIPAGQIAAEVAADVRRLVDAARPARTALDARAVQLDRTARHQLAAIVREHGGTWLVGAPESWTKDELVAEILRAEAAQ